MLQLHLSNRHISLAQALAARLEKHYSDPFQPIVIGVADRATERWIKLALAEIWGVSANIRCELPGSLIWSLIESLIGEVGENPSWQIPVLSLRIFRLLDEEAPPELGELWQQSDELGHYELSRSIARTFDRYLVYRPRWIRNWESGSDKHWQADLWRRLQADTPENHWVGLASETRGALDDLQTAQGLPEQLTLFGAAGLSPGYIELLGALAEHINVDLYALAPTPDYFSNLISSRRKANMMVKEPARAELSEVGHPLVASWSTALAETVELLVEQGVEVESHFDEQADNDRLSLLQSDMRQLEPSVDFRGAAPTLQVHGAYSPLRELEIARDQILALMERVPGLQPEQICLAVPDINEYAPLLAAGLASNPSDSFPAIPYSAVFARAAGPERVFEHFVGVLLGELSSESVVGLLNYPEVADAVGLRDLTGGELTRWIVDAGIRWGADGTDWAADQAQGLSDRHTWRRGGQALLAGYAFEAEVAPIFDGLAPVVGIDDGGGERVGVLLELVDHLIAASTTIRQAYSVPVWRDICERWLRVFFGSNPGEGFEVLRHAMSAAVTRARVAGLVAKLPWAVYWAWVAEAMSERASNILQRGVTVCELAEGRAAPFRAVFLLGLDADAFPRRDQAADFDLTKTDPRPGDRSVRADDRLHLLEYLVTTTDHVHLSYVSQDPRSAEPLAPSSLIIELLDVLEPDRDDLRDVIAEHSLQPTGDGYVDGPEYVTYHPDAASAVTVSSAKIARVSEVEAITLEELVRFYRDPARYFLERVIQARLYKGSDELPSEETWVANGLENWAINSALLDALREEKSLDIALSRLAAAGQLPLPPLDLPAVESSRLQMVEQWQGVERLVGDPLPSISIDLNVASVRLTGEITGLHEKGRAYVQPSKCKLHSAMDVWIHHLALCANSAMTSHYVSSSKTLTWEPEVRALELLTPFVEGYQFGQTQLLGLEPSFALEHGNQIAMDQFGKSKSKCLPKALLDTRRGDVYWDFLRPHLGDDALRSPAWVERLYGPLIGSLKP